MKRYILLCLLCFSPFFAFSEPLPAEAVFQVHAKSQDPNTFILNWTIKKGYFLYKKRIQLIKHDDSNFNLGTIQLPKALKKIDSQGRTELVYRKMLNIPVTILGTNPGEALLTVHYQGCSDEGFCYPPETKDIKLTIDTHLYLTDASIEVPATPKNDIKPRLINEDLKLRSLFANNSTWFIMLSFFGFGLLLAFTPCILPMIPVLSGIIIGHSHQLSTRKAFLLSFSYVLSMSITYSLIGAAIAFMGHNLQIIMQSTWVIALFGMLFIILALSMFNMFELRLPQALQNKIANMTRSRSGGHYVNAAIMGSLSILILSPCVTAPLIGALTYIANQGNVAIGMLALFFLSLGMGTPLLLIGTSAGKLLPKAGEWMNEVKAFFGVLLLAVAIYLLGRILPVMVTMGLWASLLIFSGMYLGALNRANTRLEHFNQGTGLILLIYGILILIGASQGHSDPLQPLKSTAHQSTVSTSVSSTKTVTTLDDAMAALIHAAHQGKPVMVDFYADWCASCKIMARTTLREPEIINALHNIDVLTIDLTANNRDSQTLLDHFNIIAPPTFLFFDAKGQELDDLRLVGEVSAQALLLSLKGI